MQAVSERLKAVIRMAEELAALQKNHGKQIGGKLVLADIGCDHAYVSIALSQSGYFNHVIAADIHQGPLDIAEENIRDHRLSDDIEIRLSDGFDRIIPGEADIAVITGMGGKLIGKILRQGKKTVSCLSGLVLGPQSELSEFRATLTDTEFEGRFIRIQDEKLVFEDGKYYPVIGAILSSERQTLNPAEKQYGPCLLKNQNPMLLEMLKKEHSKLKELLRMLSEKASDGSAAAEKRYLEVKKEFEVLQEAFEYYTA